MSSSSLAAEPVRGPAQMTDARLVAHQLRYDLLGVWRDPQSRFFTIVLPLIFLVLLTSLFGNHTLHVHGLAIKASTYYVPGISTLGIIATSFVNLVITITGQREASTFYEHPVGRGPAAASSRSVPEGNDSWLAGP
jgi:ABC-2 type transport system permease protein